MYDLLHCELQRILAGFYARCKREREGRAWLATHVAYAYRSETIPMPWELLGEEDPDEARRERARKEQEEYAHSLLGVPRRVQSEETPEQVLARFGML